MADAVGDVVADDFERLGREAARLFWDDSPAASGLVDPRQPAFAEGLLAGLADAMRGAPGAIRKVIGHAAAAAEDLNLEAYQGLVEVLQNADDLGAVNVRFALIEEAERRRLLIVHDGAPVTCHHVLAMTLPYLTTKTGDAEQKGRFGIGLKTLRRIASRIAVHSAPYHFAADGLIVHAVDPVSSLPGFYSPDSATLFELDLTAEFDPVELETWFSRFNEENLLFLKTVTRFAWVDLDTGEERAFALVPGPWQPLRGDVPGAERRTVRGTRGAWTVFRMRVPRPQGIDRSLKATGDIAMISLALPDHDHAAGLFIGLRTRIPVVLSFSIDAQFDPSTAREGMIENAWNKWLIARVGETVAALSSHELANSPAQGWFLIPTSEERVGLPSEAWPHDAFSAAFEAARQALAAEAVIGLDGQTVPLGEICYEAAPLEGFLQRRDLTTLRPEAVPLPIAARDPIGRWRSVLSKLVPLGEVGSADLAEGFRRALFGDRPARWWVEAAGRLTASAPRVVLGTPCWLSDAGVPISVFAKGETARPLVVGDPLSDFAKHWKLFDRLHNAYHDNPVGEHAMAWLRANAAVETLVDAAGELAAFAEAYGPSPREVTDVELRELRDRFDLLTDRKAEPLGPLVGAALRLDGFVWRRGRKMEAKVAPTEAYLSRTLDSDYPFWPQAAGELPDIPWLSSSYDERLRTGQPRASRKRSDGTISRGPRKFLMLLGSACSPRILSTGRNDGGGTLRSGDLRRVGAEYVNADFVSPHLERALASLQRLPKRERRSRSAALIKALSRYWERYQPFMRTTAFHRAIKYEYSKGEIEADWLCRLREVEWVAVGNGELVRPEFAVVRSPQTQTVYQPHTFIANVGMEDLRGEFPTVMRFTIDVRASHLVASLEGAQAGLTPFSGERLLQTYRALAKMSPSESASNSKVGDLSVQDLRRRFNAGEGLIWVETADQWRRPNELFTGRDIFHAPTRFVPGGPACSQLWNALAIKRPDLEDCIPVLRSLGGRPYSVEIESVLIDVYRHLENLLPKAEQRQRKLLRSLPVGTADGWCAARPVFHVTDRELRERLAEEHATFRFWVPPCDDHLLPNVTAALGLTLIEPALSTAYDVGACVRGKEQALRFRACVDHLSNELARNDPTAREKIGMRWETLREIPLAVHVHPFKVCIVNERLSPNPLYVGMEAVLQADPPLLTVTEDAFQRRDRCGRAIASLFPADTRHRIEAEWVASWVASTEVRVERMRMASDEEHEQAMADRATAAAAATVTKIKVTPPASRSPKAAPSRHLKAAHGSVASVTIIKGSPPKPAQSSRPLVFSPPPPQTSSMPTTPSGPVEYDNRDLEQRGWEILRQVLNASEAAAIVDLRKRHGVGADGVVGWTTFVELKATGGGPQSSVELSANEYERALERGLDFILALVSGLEEGHKTEIRLILDPLKRTSVRPMGSVRLVGLGDAPAVLLRLDD